MVEQVSGRAISRFMVVSAVRAKVEAGMSLAAAIAKVAKETFSDHDGRALRPASRSIYRWWRLYQTRGIVGLDDASRQKVTASRTLSEDFVVFMTAEKRRDHDASIPEIMRRAEELGICERGGISRTTAWRAAVRLNLPIFADKAPSRLDMQRFAYPHRMQMVLCDGKHFRVGSGRQRRVAFTFLDDASRCGLGVVVGTSESAELFLHGLERVLRRYGRMGILFVDNGSGFKHDAQAVCAKLQISLVHGVAGYPEGRGKIERFNQTMLQDLLRSFDGNPAIDPAPEALELRLAHYLEDVYNHRPHESLGKGICPAGRFDCDEQALELLPNEDALLAAFTLRWSRRVARDNVVKLRGVAYELPRGYAGRLVELELQLLTGDVQLRHQGQLITLQPVALATNAKTRRTRRQQQEIPAPAPVPSAADLAFAKKFGPAVVTPPPTTMEEL